MSHLIYIPFPSPERFGNNFDKGGWEDQIDPSCAGTCTCRSKGHHDGIFFSWMYMLFTIISQFNFFSPLVALSIDEVQRLRVYGHLSPLPVQSVS
jgi:hypothetical protein